MSFKSKSALCQILTKCSVTLLAALMAASTMTGFAFADENNVVSDTSSTSNENTTVNAGDAAQDSTTQQIEQSFSRYLMNIEGKPAAKQSVVVDLLQSKLSEGVEKKEYNGKEAVTLSEGDSMEFTVNIPEDGVYFMDLSYCSVAYKNRDIQIELKVDGSLPYNDAASISFKRLWKDKTGILQDFKGNDLTPKQEEVFQWRTLPFKDYTNYTNEEYRLFLTAGEHTVKYTMVREAIAVNEMIFRPEAKIPSYEEVKAEYDKNGYKPATQSIDRIQAETPALKSDSMIIPTYDRSSPATEPYDVSKIRRNTIGQEAWSDLGMTITYNIEAPQSGLYKISQKFRQCFSFGVATSRNIYIDGVIPFQEMKGIKYPYGDNWETKSIKTDSGEECYVYLSQGSHTISFEVTLGDWSKVLQEADVINRRLNTLYRRIIMVTSASPDPIRDYRLQYNVPNLIEDLTSIAAALREQAAEYDRLNEGKSTQTEILRNAAKRLEKFAEKPRKIQEELAGMRSDISGISSWINDSKKQPLEFDYIDILVPDATIQDPNASFFANVAHFFNSFFASFSEDYSNYSENEGKEDAIKVWISDGRDQVQIMKDLIDDSFTSQTGVPVALSLIQGGIMEATLAGIGPDIALNQARISPVNYASRNILIDLDQFDTFENVKTRFAENATVPYMMNGKTYGIPTKQTFQVLFYRTDIFEELKLEVPNTWDEFYDVLKVLQRNNMVIRLPYSDITAAGIQDGGIGMKDLFATLFLQKGGTFYDETLTESRIDSNEGLAAFKMWTEFYTERGVDVTIDFNTRFRSGEAPMGIDSIELYNTFASVGSEIRGLWSIAPVPGTVKEDGTIDRSVGESGGANVIFKVAEERKENCWKFLDWLSSTEVQYTYGTQIENLLGVASRYCTANVEAFEKLPWNKSELAVIEEQRSYAVPIPEVPGAYFIPRSIDSAFRDVQNKGKNPRTCWTREIANINKELDRKNKELGTGKYSKI